MLCTCDHGLSVQTMAEVKNSNHMQTELESKRDAKNVYKNYAQKSVTIPQFNGVLCGRKFECVFLSSVYSNLLE